MGRRLAGASRSSELPDASPIQLVILLFVVLCVVGVE
jgi:hypothetical protein